MRTVRNYRKLGLSTLGLAVMMVAGEPAKAQLPVRPAAAQTAITKPNILVIMGDDIGWFNLGAYNGGMMLNATPNLDTLATQGMRLTDYYPEAAAPPAVPISLPANCRSAPA
jgi:hypothetical protein